VKKTDLAPWSAPGSARGPLDEEWLNANLTSVTYLALTPEEKAEAEAEAQWEAKLFKAIESGEIGRGKPGRRPGKSKKNTTARDVARACLTAAGGHSGKAKQAFIKQICALNHIGEDRAVNIWYEITEPDGRTRRVR
jgi:hypothetical protein